MDHNGRYYTKCNFFVIHVSFFLFRHILLINEIQFVVVHLLIVEFLVKNLLFLGFV